MQYLSLYPGDPLTPFTPAYKNATGRLPRDSPDINVPTIPSFPISYTGALRLLLLLPTTSDADSVTSFADALPLLKSLNGKGFQMRDTTKGPEWQIGRAHV